MEEPGTHDAIRRNEGAQGLFSDAQRQTLHVQICRCLIAELLHLHLKRICWAGVGSKGCWDSRVGCTRDLVYLLYACMRIELAEYETDTDRDYLGEGGVQVTILAQRLDALLRSREALEAEKWVRTLITTDMDDSLTERTHNPCICASIRQDSKNGGPQSQELATYEGLSLTCLVKVRTLRTAPNGRVMARRSSSGKLGGNPLM